MGNRKESTVFKNYNCGFAGLWDLFFSEIVGRENYVCCT